MSFGRFSSAICFILVIWVSKLSHTSSAEEVSSHEQSLSNEDLRQLLFLLDDNSSKELEKLDSNQLLNLGKLLEGDQTHNIQISTEKSVSHHDPQQERSTTLETTTTPTPTTITTTTTTTTTPTTTTSTVSPPPIQIDRREDPSPPQPSQHDLVHHLSMFNSLLMSLSKENSSLPATPEPNPPPLNEQQVNLLKSLFGSFSPIQTTESSSSTFFKRQTESVAPPSPTTPSPSSPDIAALQELLTKISQAPVGTNGNLNLNSILPSTNNANNHLKNFHNSNANMDSAASGQLSGLLSLLGTLGSLTQLQQQAQQLQQPSTLFNFGVTPTVAPPLQSNFLTGLLQQQQSQPSQQAPNIFGNLFSQPQANQAQQPLNFGSLITPGIGSVISTMSNIFGGSGAGGKPRVRGTGVDTRLGVGYRFGDAADAQVMWDIGPQLFTEPLQNEVRYPMTKKKRQDTQSIAVLQSMQAKAQAEKEQQIAATRRFYQVQRPHSYTQNPNRRQFHINPPTTPHSLSPSLIQKLTPYAQEQALKELWQMMEMQKQLKTIQPHKRQYPSYTTDSQLLPMSQAELLQLTRNKNVIKRASTPPINTSSNFNQHPTFSSRSHQHQADESFLSFRTQHPSPNSFIRKVGRRNQPPQYHSSTTAPTSIFSNLFGRFRGTSSKPSRAPPPPPPRYPDEHRHEISHSQMSRWDLDPVNHRFDNFKHTNGELVMTDSNSNDRFYARNANNRNRGQTNHNNMEYGA